MPYPNALKWATWYELISVVNMEPGDKEYKLSQGYFSAKRHAKKHAEERGFGKIELRPQVMVTFLINGSERIGVIFDQDKAISPIR